VVSELVPLVQINSDKHYSHYVDTVSRLNALVGKKGTLKIANNGHAGFTFLSVDPAPNLPVDADTEAFNYAITVSSFRVRLNGGVLIDDMNEINISGGDIICSCGDIVGE